jgi:hypothetical protein
MIFVASAKIRMPWFEAIRNEIENSLSGPANDRLRFVLTVDVIEKLADGLPGKIVVRVRAAIDAPFRVCGDKRVGIVTVPGIDVVLCNLDSIHCVDSSA